MHAIENTKLNHYSDFVVSNYVIDDAFCGLQPKFQSYMKS